MNALLKKILDLLFPLRCPFCRSLLKEEEESVCRKCKAELPATDKGSESQIFPHISGCFSAFFYEGLVRSSLLRYKFGGLSVYADSYAGILSERFGGRLRVCNTVSWVPLSRKRLRKRGYDQAALIAEGLAAKLGLPCEALLMKTTDNVPQSTTRSAEQRRTNVRGVYRPLDAASVRGKTVLLVDDIVTTGSTIGECARVLKAAGAAGVYAATVARNRIG